MSPNRDVLFRQSWSPLPDGYEAMIRKARVALYDEEINGRYERCLIRRMEAEGWLNMEVGAWSGKTLYRATKKALARV